MTRFNTYLLNEGRSKKISLEKARDIINSNCTDILKKYNELNHEYIFRGLSSMQYYLLTDPTKGNPRKSLDNDNYYTLLMDNLPSWKKYPKRSRSLICSTDTYGARDYGNIFIVFPYNKCKIGVSRSSDIWTSFNTTLGNLPSFMGNLKGILSRTIDKEYPFDYDWKTLKDAFKKSEEYIKEYPDKFNLFLSTIRTVIRWFEGLQEKSYISLLDDLMNPSRNGFELTTPARWRSSSDRSEVWVGNGPCVLVRNGKIDEIITEKFKS